MFGSMPAWLWQGTVQQLYRALPGRADTLVIRPPVLCMTVSIESAVLTLAVCALLQGFDEVRRLGLQQETEVVVRAAKACSHGAPGGALRPGRQYGDSIMAP